MTDPTPLYALETWLPALQARRVDWPPGWGDRFPWSALASVLLRKRPPGPDWQPPWVALPGSLTAQLPHAVAKRQHEYLLGRLAAHAALRAAGCPAPEAWVGRVERRPVWPAGMTGSISHSDTLVLALAAPVTPQLRAVGVDVESQAAAPDTVRALDACFDLGERQALERHPHGVLAGFALKEALYKCLQPLVGGWIDFDDAWVEWSGDPAAPARLTLRRTLGSGFPAGRTLPGWVSRFEDHVVALVAC